MCAMPSAGGHDGEDDSIVVTGSFVWMVLLAVGLVGTRDRRRTGGRHLDFPYEQSF